MVARGLPAGEKDELHKHVGRPLEGEVTASNRRQVINVSLAQLSCEAADPGNRYETNDDLHETCGRITTRVRITDGALQFCCPQLTG